MELNFLQIKSKQLDTLSLEMQLKQCAEGFSYRKKIGIMEMTARVGTFHLPPSVQNTSHI